MKIQVKSFLLWYNERVNARGIHLSDKACTKAIGVYDIVQYFILELSHFLFLL